MCTKINDKSIQESSPKKHPKMMDKSSQNHRTNDPKIDVLFICLRKVNL